VFAPEFPDSVAGEHGHDVLYRVACELVDGFGLGRSQAMPIFREWNQAKARPPESEKQLDHKLDDAIKNHAGPSLNRLNAPLPRVADGSPSGGPAAASRAPSDLESLDEADLGLTRAADIRPAPIRWLWPYRLARSSMAMAAGDGGIGKSLVL